MQTLIASKKVSLEGTENCNGKNFGHVEMFDLEGELHKVLPESLDAMKDLKTEDIRYAIRFFLVHGHTKIHFLTHCDAKWTVDSDIIKRFKGMDIEGKRIVQKYWVEILDILNSLYAEKIKFTSLGIDKEKLKKKVDKIVSFSYF